MIFVWIICGIILLGLAGFVLLWVRAIRASGHRNRLLEAMIAPALESVEKNDASAPVQVALVASVPAVRKMLWSRLREIGRAAMFPDEFHTPEKFAESDLAQWLMHPNELGSMPSEMELVQTFPVAEEGKTGAGYLFRFRMAAPHWAADKGWMAGVAGPVWDGEDLSQYGHATFSELTPFDQKSPEQHIEFLHKSRTKTGVVVPS